MHRAALPPNSETRILAMQALACLLTNFKGASPQDAVKMRGSVVQCMEAMLNSPQPLINQAARESCEAIAVEASIVPMPTSGISFAERP